MPPSQSNKNKNKNKSENVAHLNNEIKKLHERIDDVEKRNLELEDRVTTLESINIVSSRVTEELKKEIDRLDQYGRRSNIIIKHVPLKENESTSEVATIVGNFLSKELSLPNAMKDVDKLHRVGKPKSHNGSKQQNIIVRFKTHYTRYKVYNARKKAKKFKICPNLTKARGDILYNAIVSTNDVEGIDFVYADIHGDLKIRLKEEFEGNFVYHFDSMEKLDELLAKFGFKENKDEV